MANHDRNLTEVSGELAVAAYELGNLYLEEGSQVRAGYWLRVALEHGAEGAKDSLAELQQLVDGEARTSDVWSHFTSVLSPAAPAKRDSNTKSPARSKESTGRERKMKSAGSGDVASHPDRSRAFFEIASISLAVIVGVIVVGVAFASTEGPAQILIGASSGILVILELFRKINRRILERPHATVAARRSLSEPCHVKIRR
jgi:hypothetical protein